MADLASLFGNPANKLSITDEGIPEWDGNPTGVTDSGNTVYNVAGQAESSDAALKLSLDQSFTVAIQLTPNAAALSGEKYMLGNENISGAGSGFSIGFNGGNLIFILQAGSQRVFQTAALTQDVEVDAMMIYDNTAQTIRMYVGQALVNTITSVTTMAAHGDDFFIGATSARPNGEGIVRNVEYYNKAATTPLSHVPGDPTTLGLVDGDRILQSRSGNGSDNDQGITFTETATVTNTPTTFGFVSNISYAINALVTRLGITYRNDTGSIIAAGSVPPEDPASTWDFYTTRQSTEAGITASTTQTQGQAPLTKVLNEILFCANDNDVVTLPVAFKGKTVTLLNASSNILQYFPASGDNLGEGTDISTTLASDSNVEYNCPADTVWIKQTTKKKTSVSGLTASTTQSQGQQPTTTDTVEVSTVDNAGDVVTARAILTGFDQTFINNGANSMDVFPFSGDDLGAGPNTAVAVAAGDIKTFTAYADGLAK